MAPLQALAPSLGHAKGQAGLHQGAPGAVLGFEPRRSWVARELDGERAAVFLVKPGSEEPGRGRLGRRVSDDEQWDLQLFPRRLQLDLFQECLASGTASPRCRAGWLRCACRERGSWSGPPAA